MALYFHPRGTQWVLELPLTLTDDTLDELAKDLGYRLDVILIQHEISDSDGVTQHVVNERIIKLSRAYGVTKDEVIERIGGLS